MDSIFGSHTIALTFDLAEESWTTLGKGSKILWRDILTAPNFYSSLTDKIAIALKQEFGTLTNKNYNENKDIIHKLVKNTAKSHASDYPATTEIKALGKDLEKKLDKIEEHFNNSKAGIWIDTHEKSVIVIVSVLIVSSGVGLYSIRKKKKSEQLVSLADALSLTKVKYHIGGIEMNGRISNYSVAKNSLQLEGGMTKKWNSVTLDVRGNGIVDLKTGRVREGDASVNLHIPINNNVAANGGFKAAIGQEQTKTHFEAFVNANLTSGPTTLKVECSIVQGNNNDKKCSAQINMRF